MTLGELFEETYIQGEIAIRSYDSTGTTIEHYLGDAEEFYPDEHPQILEREVGSFQDRVHSTIPNRIHFPIDF